MDLHSLRGRVTIASLAILLLAGLDIVALVTLSDRVSVSERVSRLADAERARSQIIAKDVLLLARGNDPAVRSDLSAVMDRFDRTLQALVNGGAAPLPVVTGGGGQTVEVPPAGPAIAAQMAVVQQQWPPYQTAAQAVLNAAAAGTDATASVDTVVRTNGQFLDSLESASDAAASDLASALDLLRFLGLAGALLIGVFIFLASFWVSRAVVRPIEALATVTRQVAGGDLSPPVPGSKRTDEVGVLANAFTAMTANLRGNLEAQRDAVINLSSASAEIQAAVNQLTAGATEESAAVTQIMSTVEEVRVTAEQAADLAKSVADAAARTSDAAAEGQASVGATREGIADVASKVDAIAQRILALSEQTQAIGNIVTTVADLADQSNLLAVNAAIEAAKAGEQGRGFAVVAQEVRHLADQSREATAEISGILGEIQKAANAAVMVTEQGTAGARTAVERVEQAGTVIDQLAAAIGEAAAAARQIAASAGQQRVGVDQMAAGIGNISQVSTQTVAAAHQLQREAEGLTLLAGHLRELSERFRLARERLAQESA